MDPRGGFLDSTVGARSQPIKRKEDVSSESLIRLYGVYYNFKKSAIRCIFNNLFSEETHVILNIKISKTDKVRDGNKVYISKERSCLMLGLCIN